MSAKSIKKLSKMDYIKQKKFTPSKNHARTFQNNKTCSVLSPKKSTIISSNKTSEVLKTPFNLIISAPDLILDDDASQDTDQFSFSSSIQTNNSDKPSCSSENPLLVQTITSASFERRFYPLMNFEAKQDETYSTSDKADKEESRLQMKSSNLFNSKDNCGCKHCHNEMKLNNTILLKINKKLDSMLINQTIIIRSVNPDYAKSMLPSNIPSIPLKTQEDFQKMEIFLTTQVNYEAVRDLLYSKCTSALETLSVSSERSVTGNVLSKLILNGLAKKISWSGSEDKTKFSDTKLCEVVFGAVKLRFPNSFLIETKAKIKRWFQTANGRKENNDVNDSDT